MKNSIKKGFGFGFTSGIITTLWLLIGLKSSTESTAVVLGWIITIAVADGLSDALGIHISEESNTKNTKKDVWEATITTFLTKLFFASLFIVPIVCFPLNVATIISVIIGLFLITIFSYFLAKHQKTNPWPVMAEHLLIAILVIVLTYLIGKGVKWLV